MAAELNVEQGSIVGDKLPVARCQHEWNRKHHRCPGRQPTRTLVCPFVASLLAAPLLVPATATMPPLAGLLLLLGCHVVLQKTLNGRRSPLQSLSVLPVVGCGAGANDGLSERRSILATGFPDPPRQQRKSASCERVPAAVSRYIQCLRCPVCRNRTSRPCQWHHAVYAALPLSEMWHLKCSSRVAALTKVFHQRCKDISCAFAPPLYVLRAGGIHRRALPLPLAWPQRLSFFLFAAASSVPAPARPFRA